MLQSMNEIDAPLMNYNVSITSVLEEHNHPNPNFWLMEFINREYSEVYLKDRHWHRFLINEYFRDKLSKIDLNGDESTILVRTYLQDECDDNEWLRLFNDFVAPALIHFKIGY